MLTALACLALVPVVMTAIPVLKHDAWWVRIFDFPRLQIAALLLIFLIALLAFGPDPLGFAGIVTGLVAVAFVAQLAQMLPYSRLWRKQIQGAEGGHPTVTLLVSNVLMTNREADGLHAHIERHSPDLIVLDEPDAWWEDQMRRHEDAYPHAMRGASDNTYGMLFYSRLPLIEPEIHELLEEGIPSFHCWVRVGERRVRLHLIHPKPPFPKESTSTTDRDAEIVLVGRMAAEEDEPVIVAGDLNDVAWSHSTRLFLRISRLLDPRIGRGMFNTFHAHYPFARWPLDHVFVSDHFKLVRMERLAGYGSDHFPVLIELELHPLPQPDNDASDVDADDYEEASEVVDKALREQNGGPEHVSRAHPETAVGGGGPSGRS
jgi:endonuclease/exonuclease/phosphatase (EEP) superfamily protein YafD